MEQEKLAQINLENVLNMEESYWKEKSKVKWQCDGDRNTAFSTDLPRSEMPQALLPQ